ncbi:MAG TPA: glucose 1-dehydrogenase [Xanthobacteraceae bacterium]|nr:glucose 1-dehydrogenase [Xanthobacteraceae bacterium]
MRLQNKIALVTGAGSGFGKAIAETYAREGAKVAVVDIDARAAKDVAGAIGPAAIAVACDVSRKADVDAAAAATVSAFGTIDILVNNAGTSHRNRPMLEIDEAEFDRVFAVNVKSIFLFAHAVIPEFRRHGGGVVINIGSTAGIRPRPGLAWYNATKGAVNLLSKSMAVELAPDKIRVCALAPVAGETALLPTFLGSEDPAVRAKFVASVPLGRLSLPQDVANAALFLACDEAAFLTGVVLEVDGGRCV